MEETYAGFLCSTSIASNFGDAIAFLEEQQASEGAGGVFLRFFENLCWFDGG